LGVELLEGGLMVEVMGCRFPMGVVDMGMEGMGMALERRIKRRTKKSFVYLGGCRGCVHKSWAAIGTYIQYKGHHGLRMISWKNLRYKPL
jgi:hypothetical protein